MRDLGLTSTDTAINNAQTHALISEASKQRQAFQSLRGSGCPGASEIDHIVDRLLMS